MDRAVYSHVSDDEALAAFRKMCRLEGILPALESAHAVSYACKLAAEMSPDETILVNLSGRGDKDVAAIESSERDAES